MLQKFSVFSLFFVSIFTIYAQNPSPMRGPSADMIYNEGCACEKPMWQVSMEHIKPINWKQLKKKIDKEGKSYEGYALVKVWLDESGNYCSHKWLQFTTEALPDLIEPFLTEVQFEPVVIDNKKRSFCVEIPFQFGEP